MGLILNVYRSAEEPTSMFSGSDCTNGGISSNHHRLTVVNVEGPFEPSDDAPAVELVIGPHDTARLMVIGKESEDRWVMFGGNYAGTSDSRFSEALRKLNGDKCGIVKIFDRYE